ncbi:glycosyltransferase [Parabacteroides sp. Marseille-P3160]|uniref:glycosyltransferase n=1 Tax=Parabacteroides sp. Marseille-P3160 TaxID=1917887 RepID=UPI0009BBE9C5|nr:glycosyltransferase [Parabacteroides sp. Marseille-P3160]
MRIAYLSTFYPYRGGIAQFNALLKQAFEKNEHEVKAFTFTCQYPDFLFPGKTQFVTKEDRAIPVDSLRVLNTANPLSYGKTVREILKWKPDLLILKYWMSYFAPSLGYVAGRLRKKGVKVICVIDNAIPHEPRFFDKPLAQYFFNRCDGNVVMSDAVQADLLRIKPDARFIYKAHPLYNHFGEKTDKGKALDGLGLQQGKKTLLFFGLIRDYKGLDLLIDAMGQLDDSYQLLVAGESYGSFEKYEQQIAASPAKDRIKTIVEYIDDSRVPVLFSAADLLVLPYKSATQSGVIPVAYHFEVPILATDVGGLKSTISGAGTGVVCHPDAESLTRGVQEIFAKGPDSYILPIREEKKQLSWERFADAIASFSATL